MSQLRAPLVEQDQERVTSAAAPDRSAQPRPTSQAARGSDDTMLARNTHKKITARQADGLNRREEIELTQFDKPVLDIERTSRRKNATYGAPDISEDH